MIYTIRFTKRERFCKAINHMWDNPEKYRVLCRGKDQGAYIKAKGTDCGWYIEFERR